MITYRYQKLPGNIQTEIIAYSVDEAIEKVGDGNYDKVYGFTFVSNDYIIQLNDSSPDVFDVTEKFFEAFPNATIISSGTKSRSINFTEPYLIFDATKLFLCNNGTGVLTVNLPSSLNSITVEQGESKIIEYVKASSIFIDYSSGYKHAIPNKLSAVANSNKTLTIDLLRNGTKLDSTTIDVSDWFKKVKPPVLDNYYYGFYKDSIISEADAKKLNTKKSPSPLGNWVLTQDGKMARYAYLIMKKSDADKVSMVKTKGGLPSAWSKSNLTIDKVAYIAIRSPFKLWDENVTFITQ